MNKNRYRIIFNKSRGLLMAVAENVAGEGKAAGVSDAPGKLASPAVWAVLRPVFFSVLLVFGLAASLSDIAQAQVVADPGAPANQQPTIVTSANGTTQVNIQTPSAAGVSRNAYSQFDVNPQGVILNNARTNVQTQLGGWVQGNPWLAAGTARVILNEVNSSNPSQLRGYVEVAGDRTQVVIANPAGISCDGCGFLNANRVTLTTGSPIVNSGNLEGYRVQQGAVTVEGAGMDASRADYAEIIARSVQVNAGIWAGTLKLSAGANEVNADHTQITPVAGSGAAPAYAIDVASLGGMYAGKIYLTGSESGVGVRYAGLIAAAAGDVIVTADGLLENSGRIASAGNAHLDANGGIVNSGIVYAQGAARLTAQGMIDNNGGDIQAQGNISIDAGTGRIDNAGSLIRSGGALDIRAASLENADTQGADQGIEAQSVDIAADQVNNQSGAIRAAASLALTGSGAIENTQGLISSGQTLAILDRDLASKTLAITNTGGTLIAGTSLNVDSATLSGDGDVLSQGDLAVRLSGDFSHTGNLLANGNASLETTGNVFNLAAMQAGNRLAITAANIDNAASGQISATTTHVSADGALINRGLIDGGETFIETVTLNNLGTGRIYGDHLSIGAPTLTNDAENGAAPVIAARSRLDIGAQTINNREHALIFSAGDLVIGGSLDANKQATGQAATLNNASATLEALGSLTLSAYQINNTNEHFSTQVVPVSSQSFSEFQGEGAGTRYPASSVYQHHVRDSFYQWVIGGIAYDRSYQYDYTRTTTETQVQNSDPAQILSGGAMNLSANSLLNDKSRIIAGGALTGNLVNLTNSAVAGERVITDTGTAYHYIDHQPGGCCNDWTEIQITGYNPAPTIQAISLTPTVYLQNTAPTGSGTAIGTLAIASLNQSAGGANPTPLSSLFRSAPNPNAGYLIETDPRFASYRTWLSSDYLLNALEIDPATTHKRLGDGYYEQRLLREQIAQLTGRRYLDGYASDEAQYQALMGNAATYAQAHQLRPGIALSAEQMAQLTSDIVWLVEKTVTLPDGRTAQALVPQLYVRIRNGDIDGNGALISGDSVHIQTTGDLANSGTLAGRTLVALSAENVRNLGGHIIGHEVGINARTDLDNIGGTIEAMHTLTASAGRDLNVTSTTRTQANAQGSRTHIDRVAGLYVTGSGGTLLATAGRDLSLNAAAISNSTASPVPLAGEGRGEGAGSTTIAAGNNLKLGTVAETQQHNLAWDSRNYRKENTRADIGTTIQTQGDLRLSAGNDLNAKAASVTSEQGALTVTAGNDLTLAAGEANVQRDEASYSQSRGNWGGKKTVATRDTLNETLAAGSTFSGNTVELNAGNDLTLQGSNAVSTQDTQLVAGKHIILEAATNTTKESHLKDEKKSGLFSTGGIGFTIGTRQQSTGQQGTFTTATASTVGSIQGNIDIQAGKNYTQTGSDILAPQGDINIAAQKIDITEAREASRSEQETRFRQSGLTIALTSPVISAIQSVSQMKDAASQTKDSRMQVLAAGSAALSTKNAYDIIQAGQGTTLGGKPNQMPVTNDKGEVTGSRGATAAEQAGGINVSISIGGSQSQSNSVQTATTAAGSTVAAGGNVKLSATGAGKDSDLTVQGSTLQAGNDITLKAEDEIQLLAAKNTAEQHSTNKNSSASIGVSFGTHGFGVTLSGSMGRGNADGSDVSWSNTRVEAGNQLSLQSGGDTTLRGAVASGKQVIADVGGNLNIESLQDTSQYASKQQSLGGSLTIGAGVSGSISASKSKVNSNFASVTEQSGIKAGDGGFQVNVQGNTDLKGAVIASSQAAVEQGKNHFQTGGTLTTSDIQNTSSYSANSAGINIGSSVSLDGKLAPQGSGTGIGKDSGNTGSTTQSGISGIAGNKDVRTGDKETGIEKTFDADRVQKEINVQVQITQSFGQQASRAVDNYAQSQMQALREQAATADLADKAALQARVDALRMETQVLNVLIGAVTGLAGSALAQETLAHAAEEMRKITIADSIKFKGVTDGTTLSNVSGVSVGGKWDLVPIKTGGTRLDLDGICGKANERCKVQRDENYEPILDEKGIPKLEHNTDGMVQFDTSKEGANMSLVAFLESTSGQKMAGLTGGIQGAKGTLFGEPYAAGSWQDKLIEAFGGTHDHASKVTGLYEQGNIKRGMTGAERTAYDISTAVALAPSAPFAMATLLPPEVWKAISILLGAAK